MRKPLTIAGALMLVAGVTGSFTAWSAGPAAAEDKSLVGVATAQGIRATYTVPDYVVVAEFFDGGGPIAQANVDTTGRATGFASTPYPGENAVTAPGLITFASGVAVPAYPFYARADHPVQPKSEVKDPSGTYSLTAVAEQGKASGAADMLFGGPDSPVSQSSSHSTGSLDGIGKMIMTAENVTKGLSFGDGVLKIGSVKSKSTTTYTQGDAKPVTTSELVIEGASVAGQPVTIGPDGIHPGGQTVPVPIGSGSEQLSQALTQAGVSVRTISGQAVEGGNNGDALEITFQHPIPVEGNPQGTFIYQIGGASTFILFGADAPGLPPLPVDSGPLPPESTPPAPAATATVTGGGLPLPVAAPIAPGTDNRFVGSDSGSLGAIGSGTYPPPAPDAGAGGAAYGNESAAPSLSGSTQQAVLARDVRDSTKFFYSILAIAGALLLSSSALWRLKGVKALWTS